MRKTVLVLATAFVLAACGQADPPPAPPPQPEAAPFVAWSDVPQSDISVPEGVLYSVAYLNNDPVAEVGGVPDDAPATGRTGGVSVRLPAEWEAQASGKQIRITIRASAADPGAVLGVAYTTMEVGNSGWRQFTLTPQPADYTLIYNVGTMQNGNRDYLAFRSYGDARVQIAGYRLEVVGPSTGPGTAQNSTP